jgi:nitrate reductase gamma subunit
MSGYQEPSPPAPHQRTRLTGTQRAIVVLLLLVLALVWGLLAIYGQALWL